MIRSTFDINAVAGAVGEWIPGPWTDGSEHSVSPGGKASYRLRCTRNELIDDFEVAVEAVSDTEARVMAGRM